MLSALLICSQHGRLGELMVDSQFNHASQVPWSTPIRCCTAENGLNFMNFHISCTKMQEKGEDINLTDSTCLCSPTTMFEHHLLSNNTIPTSTPLFAFETGNGFWALMRWAWFLALCNSIMGKGGSVINQRSQISHWWHNSPLVIGHGPMGCDGTGLLEFTGFLSYWHKCEEVLSLFLGFAFQSHQSILSTYEQFQSTYCIINATSI